MKFIDVYLSKFYLMKLTIVSEFCQAASNKISADGRID